MKRTKSLWWLLLLLALMSIAAWQYYSAGGRHFPAYVAIILSIGWATLVWLWAIPRLMRKMNPTQPPDKKP